MSGAASFTEEWFAEKLASHRETFRRGDYFGFLEALQLCCLNDRPLPEWVSTIVIQQAQEAFASSSTGPGKHGNWQAADRAMRIHERRWGLANFHLKARRRQGRRFVSELACVYGYGKPAQNGGNIATREDVFEFVSAELKSTPARGSASVVKESYTLVNRQKRGRPRRRRSKKPMRGGE